VALLAPQPLGELQAGFARHHDIQHHQVRVDRPQFRPGIGRIGCAGDAEALPGKIARQALPQAGVVFHDQDVGVISHSVRPYRCARRHP
jgi:hypothetical protein